MDEQVELLRAIRDEMRALNGRVDVTNAALHSEVGGLRTEVIEQVGGLRTEVTEQIGGLRSEFKVEIRELRIEFGDHLGGLRSDFKEELFSLRKEHTSEVRQNVERDLRLGTAVAELALDVRELTAIVHAWRDEHRIDRQDLRDRVSRLERRVGLEPP